MSRQITRWATFVVWVLSGAFLLASAISYYRLDRDVTALKRERASLVDQIETISGDRDSMATSLILLRNSTIGYGEHVSTLKRVLDGHCDETFTQRCVRWERYGDLLNHHQETLVARTAARDRTDYATLLKGYLAYPALIDRIQWHRPRDRLAWYANANEGAAYSLWRMGRPADALPYIRQGMWQNGRSGVTGLTYLKVLCANHAPADLVRRRYAAIRQTLREARSTAGGRDVPHNRNVAFNLEIFDTDAELLKACGYAQIAR